MELTVGQMLTDSRYSAFFENVMVSPSQVDIFSLYIGNLATVLSDKRLRHSVLSALTLLKLDAHYSMGVDPYVLIQAAMFHDCARELTVEEVVELAGKESALNIPGCQKVALLHGRAGAVAAFDRYGIVDPLVLEAIKYHTTGLEGGGIVMNLLIAADYLEPGRFFHGEAPVVDEYPDFEHLLLEILSRKIKWVMADRKWLSPYTVGAYNSLLVSGGTPA